MLTSHTNSPSKTKTIKRTFSSDKNKVSISYLAPVLQILSSPFEGSKGIVLVATEASITAESIKLKGPIETEGLDRKTICTWPVGSRITALSLSPAARPGCLQFAAAFEDHSLVYYHSSQMVQLLLGSKTWINDCAFDEISGNYLAIVSDDGKVRVWKGMEDLKENDRIEDLCEMIPMTYPLQSRGISVQFHKRNPSHILVGESCGRISLMDIQDGTVLNSILIQGGQSQLRSVQWHPENPSLIGVISGSKWIIYSFQEADGKSEFIVDHFGETEVCGGFFEWGNSLSPKMFAVTGKSSLLSAGSNPSVHIFPNGFTKVPYSFTMSSKSRITDMAWNQSANALYISSANKINFIELH